MRDLVERVVEGEAAVAKGRARSVTVNRRESPLAWLAARGLVTRRQSEAGERLRADYERAQLAAKRRFDAAVAAVGRGLVDVLWRTVCAGEALPDSERALGWPARSGRLVLTLALDRLADHYRLP